MLKSALLLALIGSTVAANASVKDRLFDFTDDYYRANGIDPVKLAGRKQAPSAAAVIDTPNFKYQRNVRVISTNGGYNASGAPAFLSIMAGFGPDGFTADAAGKKAQKIADTYFEYIFPSQGTGPVGLGATKQGVVLDTSNGYFSNNPLGLWLHVWVNFTPAAYSTKDGQKMLADLKKKNGLAKDGTPIIKTTSEIDNLVKKGFATKSTRTDGLRYAVCPVIRDPRDGGIAKNAFLNYAKRDDGTPVEPTLVNAFLSLQATGDWNGKP